ncbi:MAG: phosphoribosyltransferase [Candidatus Dormibacteria bacterium]
MTKGFVRLARAPFEDRVEAGGRLALALAGRAWGESVVLGIPRGGVAVAAAVADGIEAPLDVIVVRKLRAPGQPELAIGAMGESGARVLNRSLIEELGITASELDRLVAIESQELDRSVQALRLTCPRLPVKGKTAIIVDDGIATGATARAACQIARTLMATRVVVAAPVAAPRALAELERLTDELVCLLAPNQFRAVGQHYRDFTPTSDEVVVEMVLSNRAMRN